MNTKQIIWLDKKGHPISCIEKLKVMQQNFDEIKQQLQDIFEDGILIDIEPQQIKQELLDLIQNLVNPYEKKL